MKQVNMFFVKFIIEPDISVKTEESTKDYFIQIKTLRRIDVKTGTAVIGNEIKTDQIL